MLYTIMMLDKPGSEQLRLQTRNKHLEFMGKNKEGMRLGGPLLSDDGSRMIGSLVIKEFTDHSEAEAFVRAEPYNQAGLFEMVLIRPFHPAVDAASAEN